MLDSRVTLLEAADEPAPVRRATEDLANDFYSVFGTRPRIVTRQADAGPMTILIGEPSRLPEPMRPNDLTTAESFSMHLATASWSTNQTARAVVLSGADMRGTIYAIYEFSEEYLGVDPLYYWTDHVPIRRTRIVIPGSLKKTFLHLFSNIVASLSTTKIC